MWEFDCKLGGRELEAKSTKRASRALGHCRPIVEAGVERALVRGWMLTQNQKTYVPLDTRKTHTLILDDNDDGDAVANMLRGGAGADGGRRKAASRGHCLSEGLGYDMHVYRQQVRVPRSLGARARSRPFAPSSLPLAFRRSFV